MEIIFEELAHRHTPLGVLSLRRRTDPALGVEVLEIKLDDEFLMSSLYTEGEIALADLGLAGLGGEPLDVLVGGLGLGYTARAALRHPSVRSLRVIEALPAVIDWHREHLIPLGAELGADPRCELIEGDFFALARSPDLDPRAPGRKFHAILLDIDHSPRHVLHPRHAAFYRPEGLRRLAAHLRPGGVFALWSNDPPDPGFEAALAAAFASVETHVVRFRSLAQQREVTNTVYVGARAAPR